MKKGLRSASNKALSMAPTIDKELNGKGRGIRVGDVG